MNGLVVVTWMNPCLMLSTLDPLVHLGKVLHHQQHLSC